MSQLTCHSSTLRGCHHAAPASQLEPKVPDTCRNTQIVLVFVAASGPLRANGFPKLECTTALINVTSVQSSFPTPQ